MSDMPEASQPEPETRAECDHPRFADVWGNMVTESWLSKLKQHHHPKRTWFTFCPLCGKKLLSATPEPSAGNPPEAP